MNGSNTRTEAGEDIDTPIAPRRRRIDLPHATGNAGQAPAPPMEYERPDNIALAPEAEPNLQVLSGNAAASDDATANDNVAGGALLEVEEPSLEMIAAVAGQTLDARREQLQLQVAQLAGHLRERLREVDRREATLNARMAQLEADLRASRLWIREREHDFQARETELRRQIEELQEEAHSRPLALTPPEPAFDAAAEQAELNEREHQLRRHEDELRERRFEVDRQAAALRHAQQVWQQQRENEERALREERQRQEATLAADRNTTERELAERVHQREEQLRAAELIVGQQAEDLQQDRAAFLADRHAWDQQKARQAQAIDELRRSAEAELLDRRTRLASRQEWIERQKVGLDQVRDEALALHRQTLEMRLIAEQLWAQITASISPADVTQAVANVRIKLAEHYNLEEQQLALRRDELLELSERITRQHHELTTLRGGLRDWAVARQAEIEQQAASLVQRELALDGEQERFRQAEHEWQAERRRYEQQIRDLTCQLRTLPAAA